MVEQNMKKEETELEWEICCCCQVPVRQRRTDKTPNQAVLSTVNLYNLVPVLSEQNTMNSNGEIKSKLHSGNSLHHLNAFVPRLPPTRIQYAPITPPHQRRHGPTACAQGRPLAVSWRRQLSHGQDLMMLGAASPEASWHTSIVEERGIGRQEIR